MISLPALMIPLSLCAAPQGPPSRSGPIPEQRIERLRRHVLKSFANHESTSSQRNLRRALHAEHDASGLLARVDDLQRIFANPYRYRPRPETRGTAWFKGSKRFKVYVSAPEQTRESVSRHAVLVIKGRTEGRKMQTGSDAFASTWDHSSLLSDTLVMIPELRRRIDYDAVAPLQWEADEAEESQKIEDVRGSSAAGRRHSFNRRRLILDCGEFACRFGIRLASYFPDDFAGLIVRRPALPQDEHVLLNLSGMPILLISELSTARSAEQLRARLEALHPGSVRTIQSDSQSERSLQRQIDRWASKIERPLFPARVVCAPTFRYRRSYWIEILRTPEKRRAPGFVQPFVIAQADRSNNRIEIRSQGVGELRLLLNDALVDLDANPELVINGKSVMRITMPRSVSVLLQETHREPTRVYTVNYASRSPMNGRAQRAQSNSGQERRAPKPRNQMHRRS